MTLRIDSLSTNAGFLKDARLEFSPGLNCIIGARGTCKSTIVETIRFAFDCNIAKIEDLCLESPSTDSSSSHRGMIRTTLGDGVAKCLVTEIGSDGHDDFTIEREVEAEPRVYKNSIEELADLGVLHKVEIYSQGDLQQIAQNESLRLELIDRPNKAEVMSLDSQRKGLAERLEEVGLEIRQKTGEIEVRRADVRGLDALMQQLAELQAGRPELPAELDKERQATLQRTGIIDAVKRGADEGNKLIHRLGEALENQTDFEALVRRVGDIDNSASHRLAAAFGRLATIQKKICEIIAGAQLEEFDDAIAELHEEFEQHNRRYHQLRHEQQEVSDSLKKEDGLKKKIDHLARLRSELDTFIEKRQAFVDERSRLRTQIQTICDKIHDLRENEVDRVNEQHGDVVILTLNLGVRSEEYAKKLGSLIEGSRIRGQDDIAREIAAHFRPCDLVDIVESSDSERLATALDRDLSQMARFVSYLMDNPKLYSLESIVFDDKLEITLFDRGIPKSISELSKGQMATALLPLILRPAPYPLVFDQPEDDLDNSFIYQTLVQQVQRLKLKRQLIFVTHNANIPVLGDAETVIVMEMQSPTRAAAPQIGTVDEVKPFILDLLEGGSKAFRLRQERYKGLLKDAETDGTLAAINN